MGTETYAVRVRGAGVVCALGVGAAAVRENLAAGRGPAAFQGPSPSRAAYPAPFDAVRDLPRGLGRRLGRQLAMSLAAALDAVDGERGWNEDPSETGIVAATAHGPIDETVDFIAGAARNGARYASPLLFSGAQHSSMVGVVARELSLRGPAMVMSNGDVSFETALLVAVAGLRAGRMRRVIVVGADAYHVRYAESLAHFGLISDSSSPDDVSLRGARRGFHLGEGAGVLLLEWGPRDIDGVYVEDVSLGSSALRHGIAAERVQAMALGDAASVRRHAKALAAIGASAAEAAYPASRFGSFCALSAVAITTEAASRLRSGPDARRTRFVSVPRDAVAASVVLSGGAGG